MRSSVHFLHLKQQHSAALLCVDCSQGNVWQVWVFIVLKLMYDKCCRFYAWQLWVLIVLKLMYDKCCRFPVVWTTWGWLMYQSWPWHDGLIHTWWANTSWWTHSHLMTCFIVYYTQTHVSVMSDLREPRLVHLAFRLCPVCLVCCYKL